MERTNLDLRSSFMFMTRAARFAALLCAGVQGHSQRRQTPWENKCILIVSLPNPSAIKTEPIKTRTGEHFHTCVFSMKSPTILRICTSQPWQ
jgi:hypothetical protein